MFGAERVAAGGTPEVFGAYARGCVAGAERLPETGPTWAAMRLSRNRNWGHPELLDYVRDLSARVAAETSWNGLYVGDMSQPRGGPMLSGHVSHQSGLDVDIWMLPPTRFDLSAAERENLSSISTRSAGGARVGENWTPAHMEVMRLAASDPRWRGSSSFRVPRSGCATMPLATGRGCATSGLLRGIIIISMCA